MVGLEPEAAINGRELLGVIGPMLDSAAQGELRAAVESGRQVLLHLHDDFGAHSLRFLLKPAALAGAWIGSLAYTGPAATLDIERATIARVETRGETEPAASLHDPVATPELRRPADSPAPSERADKGDAESGAEIEKLNAALAQSRRRLREFTRLLPGAMFQCALRPELAITYVSDGVERLVGAAPGELLGDASKLLARLAPASFEKLRARLSESAATLESWRLDTSFEDRDGRRTTVRIVAEPVVSADAGTYYHGLLLDATELEHLERKYAELERLLQSVCANAGIGVLDWDIESGVVEVNAKLREVYGLESAEAPVDMNALVAREHTADAARKGHELEALLRGESDEFYCAYRIQNDEFKWRWVLGIGWVTDRDPVGAPRRFVGTVRAVSSRNELDTLDRGSLGARAGGVAGLSDRFGIPGCLFELRRSSDGHMALPYLAGDIAGIDPTVGADPLEAIVRRIDRHDLRALVDGGARAAERLEPWECDFRLRDGAGRKRWLYLRAVPSRVDGGVVFSGFALDVTARKRTEQALIASEKRFRDLYDFAPIMLHSVDSEGRISNVNRQWLDALGYELNAVLGKRTEDFMVDPSRCPAELRDLDAASQGLDAISCVLVKADGRPIDVLLSMGAEHDRKGRFVGAQFSMIDVTERNLAVRALAESQARYRAVVHDQTEVICRFDTAGTLQFVNDAGLRLTGRHVEQLIGSNWFDLIEPSSQVPLKAALAALSPEAPISQQELKVVAASTRWYQWTIRGFFDARSKLSGYQAVGRDIDQIKQLESQIREISNREQKRIGHDLHDGLGQELTGISLMLKTLGRDIERSAPELGPRVRSVHEMVAQCISSAKALAQGLAPVHLEGDGFGGAMGQLAANMESVYGIPVHYYGAHGISVADEDLATDMYRIVQEALSNAAKHARARKIALRLRTEDGDLILEVEDDGVGLPRPADRGAGMGLKIMQYRANIIGASLSFESGRQGGTLVRCRVHDFVSRGTDRIGRES